MATVALKSSAGKWIMVSTLLASTMAFIDGTALNVVLPALQKSLNATSAELFWLLNAYLLMLASLILIGGSAIAGVGLLIIGQLFFGCFWFRYVFYCCAAYCSGNGFCR